MKTRNRSQFSLSQLSDCFLLQKHMLQNTQPRWSASLIEQSASSVRTWLATMGFFLKVCKAFTNGLVCSGLMRILIAKATQYIQENSTVNGRPNITTLDLCKWINKSLLPNFILELVYPRKVSIETARKWLHELGFQVLITKNGIFIDGHER